MKLCLGYSHSKVYYQHFGNHMSKKIVMNGIELSLPKYNASAVTLFDYLDVVISDLQEQLSEDDGTFQISIDVDFATNKSPRHKIYSNGTTKKRTKDKITRILNRSRTGAVTQVSGSVRVNLQVEDR